MTRAFSILLPSQPQAQPSMSWSAILISLSSSSAIHDFGWPSLPFLLSPVSDSSGGPNLSNHINPLFTTTCATLSSRAAHLSPFLYQCHLELGKASSSLHPSLMRDSIGIYNHVVPPPYLVQQSKVQATMLPAHGCLRFPMDVEPKKKSMHFCYVVVQTNPKILFIPYLQSNFCDTLMLQGEFLCDTYCSKQGMHSKFCL